MPTHTPLAPKGGGFKNSYRRLRQSWLWWPTVVVVVIMATLAMEILFSTANEKALIVIEGETPYEKNFNALMDKRKAFSSGTSLTLLNNELPENEDSFRLSYEFNIQKKGVYWVMVAGTPPGGSAPDSTYQWFSPYWIAFDGKEAVHLTIDQPKALGNEKVKWVPYSDGGYYWTRLGTLALEPGQHTFEIRVNEPRIRDGSFAFYFDALILAPKGWKPIRPYKGLPRWLFYATDNV